MPAVESAMRSVAVATMGALLPACSIHAQVPARAPASHSAARSEWTVDPQPSVRSAMSADVDFAAVMGVTRLPTGGVVIASDLRNNVQVFTSVDGL